MGTYQPPTYYFSGIGFNSAFYEVSTTGISLTQANALYLRKTTQDTATAIETFNAGIKANSIDALTSTGNMVINTGTGNTTVGATSGVVYIGNNQVGLGSVINIGSSITETRFAGTIKTQVVNPVTTGGTLSVATGDASNVLALHNTSSRTGAINIGNGASSTGAIKIGDATQTSNIFIGSNNTTAIGTDNVYMGASTKTVNINGTLKFNDGGGSLIMGSSGTSYISLGAMNTTFNIGGASSPFNLNSPIKTGFAYSNTSTMPNEVGARVDAGGGGGALLTIIGDGQWRNCFYVNNCPQGIYMFQYWANPGGASYSGVSTQVYQRASVFTATGTVLSGTVFTSQLYTNMLTNLVNPGTQQTAFSWPVYVDASTPNVCLALQCTTVPSSFATYHGLTLWRIA